MNPCHPENVQPPDERVAALINEYFDRRRAGEPLSSEAFVAEHRDLAEVLRPYMEGLSLLERIRPIAADDHVLPDVPGYRLLSEIGRGGMGVVYKALQVGTNRIVAVKVMLAGAFAAASARRRFRREVELTARLQHAGIVRVLESAEVAQQPYFAMDYVEGRSLDRFLSATPPPDRRAKLALFTAIGGAVEYAHAHGVIHRDLKPTNVLVDDDGAPHILDFGLAKAIEQAGAADAPESSVSMPGQVMGTVPYLSPEQAAGAGAAIDARADVYALGVMLYEALTGSLPFDVTGRPSEVIQRIIEDPPIPPSSLAGEIDSELEAILLKALEKAPALRFQSARAFVEDLRHHLRGEPIVARRRSRLRALRTRLARHRRPIAVGATVLVLSLAGPLGWLRWHRQQVADARLAALGLQQLVEQGEAARVLAPAMHLYEQHPRVEETALVWAQAQRRSGRQEDAVRFLELRIQSEPSRWACGSLLAEIYEAAGNAARAQELRARFEDAEPPTADGWYVRSMATIDRVRAARCAEEAVHRAPSHSLAWRRLAYLRLQSGDFEGALDGADRLLDLGEPAIEWSLFKGHVLVMQGRFREAVEQYTQVLAGGSAATKANVHRADAYRRLGEHEKAVEDYTRQIEYEGEETASVWYRYQRATPLWILGRTDEALDDCRRVRALLGRPFYSDARQVLMLRGQGRARKAEEVLAAALRDVESEWLRSIFRCLAGEIAPEALVAAARDGPEQLCEACYYAGEVCLSAGRTAEARQWFERCVRTGIRFDPNVFPPVPMNEHELAAWRLSTLLAADDGPPEN